jgi:hypothetical protein
MREVIAILAGLALAGCTIEQQSNPPRTATEQLLISGAADAAAQRLHLPIDPGTKVFVDAANFEGIDGKYAVNAIHDRLLKGGARLMSDKAQADMIVEIRAGALSVDEDEFLIGTPKSNVPIPLAGAFTIPEIALFKKGERRGVAKFVATAYRAKNGEFVGSTAPQYGFSHKTEWTVLIFVNWSSNDLIPKEQREPEIPLTSIGAH